MAIRYFDCVVAVASLLSYSGVSDVTNYLTVSREEHAVEELSAG